MRPAIALVLFAGLAGGCAADESYLYRPEQTSVLVDGFPGARHLVPPEAPEGDVRVASFGVTEMTPAQGAAPLVTLHVRLVVANEGDAAAWQVDTSAQQIEIPGEGRSVALYVNGNGNAGSTSIVSVAQRERRTLDFYFPLPATVGSAAQLPRFDFLWQVQTATRMVSDRTVFDRQEAEDERAYQRVTVVAGWGPWWWYNPYWGRPVVYVHPRPIVIHDHSRPPVIVVPRPHRVYVGHPVRVRRR